MHIRFIIYGLMVFLEPVHEDSKECSIGIWAYERARTVQAILGKDTKPEDLTKPGHIFPLKAKAGGVYRGLDIQRQQLTLRKWQI